MLVTLPEPEKGIDGMAFMPYVRWHEDDDAH
jgi:hypothetical protein